MILWYNMIVIFILKYKKILHSVSLFCELMLMLAQGLATLPSAAILYYFSLKYF